MPTVKKTKFTKKKTKAPLTIQHERAIEVMDTLLKETESNLSTVPPEAKSPTSEGPTQSPDPSSPTQVVLPSASEFLLAAAGTKSEGVTTSEFKNPTMESSDTSTERPASKFKNEAIAAALKGRTTDQPIAPLPQPPYDQQAGPPSIQPTVQGPQEVGPAAQTAEQLALAEAHDQKQRESLVNEFIAENPDMLPARPKTMSKAQIERARTEAQYAQRGVKNPGILDTRSPANRVPAAPQEPTRPVSDVDPTDKLVADTGERLVSMLASGDSMKMFRYIIGECAMPDRERLNRDVVKSMETRAADLYTSPDFVESIVRFYQRETRIGDPLAMARFCIILGSFRVMTQVIQEQAAGGQA